MKTLLRCSYAALIVLTLAIQVTHGQHGHIGTDTTKVADGLKRLNVQIDLSTEAEILTGQSPNCGQPIRVMLLRIDGAEDERLLGLRPADDVIRFVYLGSVEENPDRAVMIRRSIWASVLFSVGLRSIKPPSDFVVVILPRACPGLAKLDWAVLSPGD